MPTAPLRILCTGDVHLGRRPSRVPLGEDALGAQHVWRAFVEAALQRDVDAVVLTGDVVDAENKMYEALGPLERGVQRLLSEAIPVIAVAGNHDFDAFPRLVGSIEDDRFHLLGPDGTWDAVTITGAGGQPVRFVGWSFPEATVPRSPLDGATLSASPEPTLGVLHCDAGRSTGRYAPVERGALARAPVDAWLLGHIHKPTAHRENGQLQLYPGSLQPLDPGETGAHGAWLVTVSGAKKVQAQRLPLSTVRYARLPVDITDAEAPGDIEEAVMEAIRQTAADLTEEHPRLQHIAYRLVFDGRTNLHDAARQHARKIERDLDLPIGTTGCTASVEGHVLQTKPSYDLEAVARGDGPASVLARLLHDLETGAPLSPDAEALLPQVRRAVQTVHDQSGYEHLRYAEATRDAPSPDALRRMTLRQGYRLLDRLHAE
jgi:predicted phosphodiesterase